MRSSQAVRDLLSRLGEKWTLGVLNALGTRPHRYNELRRQFEVTSKVLTRVLRTLESDRLITRFESPTMRRQVDYALTPRGESLVRVLEGLNRWLEKDRRAVLRVTLADSAVAVDARQASPPETVQPQATPTDDTAAGIGSGVNGESVHHAPPALEGMVLNSVTIVVRNIDRSTRTYTDVLGLTVPRIWEAHIGLPTGQKATIKFCVLPLSNFRIMLAQHVKGATPHREFIKAFGEGIHHIGFFTDHSLQDTIKALQQMGGTCTVGDGTLPYAQVDFREQLGMTLGIFFPSQRTGKQAAQGASSVATGPNALARQRFTHVGIIVRDLERVARTYADLLGVGLSPIRTVNLAFPGRKGDGRGRARIAYLRKRGVALKLIEPLGPSPLQDFVSRRGSAIHHIGFDVGSRLRDTIRWLERCGGRQVLGHADRGYAQIDLTRQLGLVVELGGTPN